MVYLSRIYTRSGDQGQTSLGDGTRVSKSHRRIRAYGGVDELNSVMGVVRANVLAEFMESAWTVIQNDLFDVGADLCIPETPEPPSYTPLRVSSAQVQRLETWIDESNDRLSPLTSFILPGGTVLSSHLHWCRTVCRRVEWDVVELSEHEQINPHVLEYLNRLSDLMFVWARRANDDGRGDILWVPGQNRGDA